MTPAPPMAYQQGYPSRVLMTLRVTTPKPEGRHVSVSAGPEFTFFLCLLNFCSLSSKTRKPFQVKKTHSRFPVHHSETGPPAALLPTPITPKEKTKDSVKSHLQLPGPAAAPAALRLPHPHISLHRRGHIPTELASSCSHLRRPGGGRKHSPSMFPSAVPFQVEKCTFYFNRGVNPPHLQLL